MYSPIKGVGNATNATRGNAFPKETLFSEVPSHQEQAHRLPMKKAEGGVTFWEEHCFCVLSCWSRSLTMTSQEV